MKPVPSMALDMFIAAQVVPEAGTETFDKKVLCSQHFEKHGTILKNHPVHSYIALLMFENNIIICGHP